MTIRLDPEFERIIAEKVNSGLYPSAEAMVEAGIARLLQDQDEFAPGELDSLVKAGQDELDAGKGLDGKQVFDDLRRQSADIRAGRKP